jgi:hypothetical protein
MGRTGPPRCHYFTWWLDFTQDNREYWTKQKSKFFLVFRRRFDVAAKGLLSPRHKNIFLDCPDKNF